MNAVLRGGLAGIAGTGLMTGVMTAGRLVAPQRHSPEKVTETAEEKTGLRGKMSESGFHASWLALHFGFGAGSGVGYTLARRLAPLPPVLAGLTYGGIVYAANYLGIMPALGLYPMPADDSRARTVVLIAAHAVYGITTAEVDRLLGGR